VPGLVLAALILPLGLDTFAIAGALGVSGVPHDRRLRLSLLFALFEGGMPLVGLFVGSEVGDRVGSVAAYAAVIALIAVGLYELFGDEEREEGLVRSLARARGAVLIGAGVAVSLDELAIGLVFGLLDVPVLPASIAIAIQAIVLSQLGFALGHALAERVRERLERAAGVLLIVIALALLGSQLLR
jgi:putative Mn2+ efflux pump MntP